MTGKQIAAVRERLGLNATQLGLLCGVHPSSVYRWESEDQPVITFLQLAVLVRLRDKTLALNDDEVKALGQRLLDAAASGGVLRSIAVLMAD